VRKAGPVDEVVFGRYRLLSVIGAGGMGKVYKAHDTEIGRDVAIKVLPTELGADREYRQRFRREAYMAARLTEPHIIPIHDTGEIDGQLYLVMPIIDGIDVHGLLQRDGPFNPHRAVHIIEQLAAALAAAHAVGLVHRDIKPSNALVTAHDFVYLIDFGIARDAAATKLTGTGMILGTLTYMAPERFSNGVVDARSDIYALACVLHECLTGRQPFPGESMEQQIAGHLTLPPPRPSQHRADVPVGFDDVIATGMAKNPDQRYQSADQLATAAHQALTATPSPIPRAAPSSRADPTRTAPRSTLLGDQPTSPPTPEHERPADHDLAPQHPPGQPPALDSGPADQPASQPVSALRPQRRPGPIAAAVTVAVLAAAIIGIAAYVWRSQSHPPQTPSAQSIAPSLAPSGPQVAPVQQAALQGLLLSPGQLDTAMGATGMAVTGTLTTLPDGSGQVPDKACVALEGAGQATVYAGSGFTAVSGQRVADQAHAHLVEQIVVSFSSAQDARAFFAASAQRWPACSNRQHDESTTAGQTQVHTVGPVSNTNGTLSATITGILARNGASAVCERALTVANNVAIDIDACGVNPSGAAVNIADQIATKVPTT
jgi:serine/threonine kinase PknH